MKKQHCCLLTLILTTLSIETVQATSYYQGSGALHVSIDSISNISNPNAGYGNDILYFDPGPSRLTDDSGSIINGTVNLQTEQYSNSAIPVLSTVLQPFNFSQNLNIEFSTANGNIESYYFGEFLMSLHNNSSDTYQLDLTVNSTLSTLATGEFAESTMSFTTENLGTDLEFVDVYSHHQTGIQDNYSYQAPVQLILAPGEDMDIYSAIEFSGSASASPVPLPGSFWFFGLGLLSIVKTNIRQFFNTRYLFKW